MARYTKENSRIEVQFIDGDTDEVLFTVNRNILNVGELFSIGVMDNLLKNHFRDKTLPENVMIIAVAEYNLTE